MRSLQTCIPERSLFANRSNVAYSAKIFDTCFASDPPSKPLLRIDVIIAYKLKVTNAW